MRHVGDLEDRRFWEPTGSEAIAGIFHTCQGMHGVQTPEGIVWLLSSDAEDELERARPEEGQLLRITHSGDGRPHPYQVAFGWHSPGPLERAAERRYADAE